MKGNIRCPDGCGLNIDEQLEWTIKDIEKDLKRELYITSGARCPKHNEKVGGKPNSAHIKGLAVDVSIPDSSLRYLVLRELYKRGIERIGIGKDFIHFDLDKTLPAKVVWTYYV